MRKYKLAELFCGPGGFAEGAKQTKKFTHLWVNDIDPSALNTFSHNHPECETIQGDGLKIFNNQKSFCLELKSKLEETIKYLETSSDDIVYLNEDGSKEVWKDTTREKVLSDARNDYKECLEALNRIDAQLKSLNE